MRQWTRLTGIDGYSDSSKNFSQINLDCNIFCKQWQESNCEQVEHLSNKKVKMIYCSVVGPRKYELKFSIGIHKVFEWFGTACCSYAAMAKAFQNFYDESY